MTKKKVKYLDKNNKEISKEKFEKTFLKSIVKSL
tara:strand:- start:86 stop:187 length:102 start_codon:yes stop_codon:yes gene_type:complete